MLFGTIVTATATRPSQWNKVDRSIFLLLGEIEVSPSRTRLTKDGECGQIGISP